MLWARERFPHHVGDLNHSVRFLNDFLPSLMAAAHTCTAASLHTVVPATGLPSLLCRVVDVVSINGRSLFPTIHIYTDAGGKLQWALSGCPCLEYVEKEAIGSNQGPGSIFGFHKAPQLVKAVHRVEDSLCIGRDDRAWRLVCTVADQAIQGKGSTQMSREEAAVDRLPEDPLAEGVCKFHIADGVGAHVDARFPETQIFDRMLRLVRRSFAFGTGDVILRSLANKFTDIATEYDRQASEHSLAAVEAEVQGKPLAAKRFRQKALFARREATALRQVRWTSWQKPRAPSADGTRKVVWQARSREMFFEIFGLVFWGIKARMQQTLEASQRGQLATSTAGSQTKEMRSWRSLGRALTDCRILVFNLGRVDFRRKNLASYAMRVQASLTVPGSVGEQPFTVCEDMFTAIGVLVEMRGVVLLMQRLCLGLALTLRRGQLFIVNDRWLKLHGPGCKSSLSMPKLRLVCQTLLVHKCWRAFPGLSLRLPELLLGGSFAGVRLQTDDFVEPAVGGDNESKWDRAFRCRGERFEDVSHSIDRLISWAKDERLEFMERVIGNISRQTKRTVVAQGTGTVGKTLPYVPEFSELDAEKFNYKAEPSSKPASASRASSSDGDWVRCSFVKRPRPPVKEQPAIGGKASTYMDLIGDAFCPENVAHSAALELDDACQGLFCPSGRLSSDDLSAVLSATVAKSSDESTVAMEQASDTSSGSDSDADREAEAQPLASPVDSAIGEPLTSPVPSAPTIAEPIGTIAWVITRNPKTGKWQFVPYPQYKRQWRERLQDVADPRARFLSHGTMLFGSDAVTQDHNMERLRPALLAVQKACTGRLWG